MSVGGIICLFVLNVIHLHTCRSVTGNTSCPKLSLDEMRSEWDKLHMEGYEELHWSFRLVPDVMNGLQIADNHADTQSRRGTRTTHLYGPKRCPKKEIIDFYENCPSRYIMHHDKNRIPLNIVHAKCVCDKCRYSNASDYETSCQPVYTWTKVLRRDVMNNCAYNWSVEKIPVACACEVIKRTVVNDELH